MMSILIVALVAFAISVMAFAALTASRSRVWDTVASVVVYSSGVVSVAAAVVALMAGLL